MEDIIGDMFFHPEDQECLTRERLLNLFQISNQYSKYTATFKKTASQFLNVVDCIAQCLSFRQVQGITTSNEKRFGLINKSITSDTEDSNIARQIGAIYLQVLSSSLNSDSVWTFANDISTHRENSYFDNRIRVCLDWNLNLYNFHATSIPMVSRHITPCSHWL